MAPITKHSNKVKVVLTGFEPFGKHETNPSWLSVSPLHNTLIDLPTPKEKDHHGATQARLICQELPVEYRKVPELVPALHVQHSKVERLPALSLEQVQEEKEEAQEEDYLKTYFIHVGVGRKGHTAIETLANRTGYGALDNSKWQPASKEDPPVIKAEWSGDADVYHTTVDTLALAKELTEEKGWKCQQSLDAGHYLCEYTFYLSMAERQRRIESGQEQAGDRACLFVHLPPVGEPYTLEELKRFVMDMVVAVVSKY